MVRATTAVLKILKSLATAMTESLEILSPAEKSETMFGLEREVQLPMIDIELKRFAYHPDGTLGVIEFYGERFYTCLLYTSPSPRDRTRSRMPSSA